MNSIHEDRLARLAALRPARKGNPTAARAETDPPSLLRERIGATDEFAQNLGAVVARNRYGEHLQVSRWFSSPEPCTPSSAALRLLVPSRARLPAGTLERMTDPEQWLFLDTETTGLAGGTGTYAFLVGVAWWEAGGLHVEQLFMRNHDEEHSLLLELAGRMAERRVLVTFNGKTFDWPLLETRYTMTRAIAPHSPVAHLDLLHPARQLWRLRLGSVRLKDLEQHVLGPNRLGWHRADDIDSATIPQIYFDYLRRGPSEPLAGVFRHNQMDLRGLAALSGKLFSLLGGSEPPGAEGLAIGESASEDGLELYGLSRLLRQRGEDSRARRLNERALAVGLPAAVDRAARRQLAFLAKRERDYARATSLWEELLRRPARRPGAADPVRDFAEQEGAASHAPSGNDADPPARSDGFEVSIEAYEQLAIYYEHRAREPQRAAQLTRDASAELRKALRSGSIEPGAYRRLQTRLEHRLARLTRKSIRPMFETTSSETAGRATESNEKR